MYYAKEYGCVTTMFKKEVTMKTQHYAVLLLAVLVLLPLASNGQTLNYLRVPPYTVTSAYLNDVIVGDTLPNGTRRDPNVVYVLQRGGLYYVNAIINTQASWQLRITANDSTTTRRPVILLHNVAGGTRPPGNFVNLSSNLTLKNVILSGYDELVPSDLGGLQGGLIATAAQGLTIVIDSCILKSTNGNHIRTDQAARYIKVTNTIFADMGYLGRSNLGAGKGIDLRAGSCDSLILMNNTFVNWQDRIVRHFASTLNIQYMRFEHNTLVNGMSYHGMLSLGKVGRRMIIRDNLLVDAFALGNDSDAVRQAEFTDSGELDRFGKPGRMTWVIANPNDTTSWLIKNNYYNISAAGQSFWDSASILPIVANPPLTKGDPLTYKINSRIGADSLTAFRSATVTLVRTPALMKEMMKWYRRPSAPPDSGAGKTKGVPGWSSRVDFDRKGYQYYRDSLNCSYPTSNAIYTAGTGGYPVGDLNWFPTRYAQWLVDPVSGVSQKGDGIPETFSLNQNYPNPFNPATRISFNLNRSGFTTLTIYNLLGQKVATPVEKVMNAGFYELEFDATNLTTGVYFYRLESGNYSDVKKMMLLK
jgi:hypothetical protein